MSNRKFVCFDCRASIRRDANTSNPVLCPSCGKETVNIGYKIPIPPKTKAGAWLALRQQLNLEASSSHLSQQKERVAELHAIEKEIQKIESLPSNSGRDSLLKQLKKRLASYNA